MAAKRELLGVALGMQLRRASKPLQGESFSSDHLKFSQSPQGCTVGLVNSWRDIFGMERSWRASLSFTSVVWGTQQGRLRIECAAWTRKWASRVPPAHARKPYGRFVEDAPHVNAIRIHGARRHIRSEGPIRRLIAECGIGPLSSEQDEGQECASTARASHQSVCILL